MWLKENTEISSPTWSQTFSAWPNAHRDCSFALFLSEVLPTVSKCQSDSRVATGSHLLSLPKFVLKQSFQLEKNVGVGLQTQHLLLKSPKFSLRYNEKINPHIMQSKGIYVLFGVLLRAKESDEQTDFPPAVGLIKNWSREVCQLSLIVDFLPTVFSFLQGSKNVLEEF